MASTIGPPADFRSFGGWRRSRPARAAAALLALAAAGCSDEPEAPAEAPVRPAKLLVLQAEENVRTVSLPAIVEATASADLGFPQAGKVTDLSVRQGESVAEGAEIARLDRRELKTDLATARANHDAAQAEFERAERLVADGVISRMSHEQKRARRDVTAAALAAARKRFDDSVLRSPFAGVVAVVHVEAFENVGAQQAVVTLQTSGSVEAVVQAPATLVANSGRIEPIETVVVLDAAPDVPIPARFRSAATRADPAAQTFEVRFSFTPPPGLVILPGMTGAVRSTVAIAGDAGAAQIAVPIEAILSEAGLRYVWVVDTDSMTVAKREVILRDGVGETLPVRSGLAAGDTIVAAGVSYLHEGMKIRRYEP